MSNAIFSESQASLGPANLPGAWRLESGRALSLQPQQAGVLRIAAGKAWATFDGPHSGPANQLGDLVLQAGDQLTVQAGQNLVFEPIASRNPQAVSFEWTPATEAVNAPVFRSATSVTQPLHELGQALGMVGAALAHLSVGLFTFGRHLLAGRPAVQAPHCG